MIKPITTKENWKPALAAKLTTPCLECTSHARGQYGHCQITRNDKTTSLHRFLYEEKFGTLPETTVVRHRCDNPPCINLEHLEPGSHADNIKDRDIRGRNGSIGEQNRHAKLKEDQVVFIYLSTLSRPKLAKQFGVNRSCIDRIKDRSGWRHITDKLNKRK